MYIQYNTTSMYKGIGVNRCSYHRVIDCMVLLYYTTITDGELYKYYYAWVLVIDKHIK